MTSPSIVQSAFTRGTGSPLVVTLPAPPTAGNWLVFVALGRDEALTPPASLIVWERDIGNQAAYQGTQLWMRTIGAGDFAGVLPGPHRYWRLANLTSTSNAFSMVECQFRTAAGTPLLFSGGTASAAQVYSGMPASNAADNNASTMWSSNNNTAGQWWQYDYGAGNSVAILEVSITARNDSWSGQTPSSFDLQCSDDGVSFTTAWSASGIAWSAGQTQTFLVPNSGMRWSFTGAADYHDIAAFEIANQQGLHVTAGACTGSGTTTITTGTLAAPADADGIRLLAVEWDNAVSATLPSGFTRLSPAAWQGTGVHDAAIYQIPNATTGTQAISMSGNTNAPVFLDIQIGSVPLSSNVRVSQVGDEVWAHNPDAPLRLGQVGAEAWVSYSTPYVPPVVTVTVGQICIIT